MPNAFLRAEGWLRGSRLSKPVRRVLVLEYRLPLGCCVHMTPFFEAVKRSRPEVEITVATRALGAQVLRNSPFTDHLIETPDPLTDLPAAVRELRGELRRRGIVPDCVLTGASDPRTRISLLGVLAANGWRGGYTLKPGLYHRPLVYDWGRTLIANNLRVAELIGCEAEVTRPRVFFLAADVEAAEGMLAEATPGGKTVVTVVTQNSGGQQTGWHTERWVRVIEAAEEMGCAVVYVGTAGDAAAVEAIRAAAGGHGASLAGRTTVNQLAAVLAMSDLVVTLDTGTMHVGRAAGVPMVVLGPSWQKPLEWMPLGVENVRILRGNDREDVPAGYRLDEIEAADVERAMEELLRVYPAQAKMREERVRTSLSTMDHLATPP